MRDATRIFGLVLAVGIVVVGCETLTGTNTVDPPKWIHGTWEACAGEGVHRWEFGTRKAVFTDGNGRVVYSELGGAGVTVKDEASSSRYSISYANGPADAVTVIIFTRRDEQLREFYFNEFGRSEVESEWDLCRR